MAAPKTKYCSVYMERALWKRLRALARADERSDNYCIVQAVRDWINRKEQASDTRADQAQKG